MKRKYTNVKKQYMKEYLKWVADRFECSWDIRGYWSIPFTFGIHEMRDNSEKQLEDLIDCKLKMLKFVLLDKAKRLKESDEEV